MVQPAGPCSPLPHHPGQPEPVNPSPSRTLLRSQQADEGLTEPGLKAPDPAAIREPGRYGQARSFHGFKLGVHTLEIIVYTLKYVVYTLEKLACTR